LVIFEERTRGRVPSKKLREKNGKFIQAESLLQEVREKPANERLPGFPSMVEKKKLSTQCAEDV
jgi:hypothetical protein